ncbi:hypothetical protein GGR54DRAFT_640663 [Hypoxylon sp. NC1633]|nr:hypothetical protein GGR54DRAFT_640663 [Hypoxylon sp. NC1633]
MAIGPFKLTPRRYQLPHRRNDTGYLYTKSVEMRIMVIIGVLFGAALCASLKLLEDMDDGLYTADFGPDSTGEIELLALYNQSNASRSPLRPKSRLDITRRMLPIEEKFCAENRFLNYDDYAVAFSQLTFYCKDKPFVRPQKTLAYKVGSAVVYMCNYGRSIECLENEINDDMEYLDAECHSDTTVGWVYHGSVRKTYGRDLASEPFCQNAN